jgi:Na+-translocating ferredoxin:NAD+ oxidoreductase RNF subunit RnfB
LGLIFGAGLGVASIFLAVKKNERLAHLEEALPGLNCGACGYAGCSAYAEAIAESDPSATDGVPLDLCKPGGADTVAGISKIMGVEVSAQTREKQVAQAHCRGGRQVAKTKFTYNGIRDCNALYSMYGGDKTCPFGCLGLGSCIRVCPVNAIDYDNEGLVWVDKDKCIACGQCIDICPTKVMQYLPYSADYFVACSSTDKGPVVRKYCSVGCIGCKVCEKKSPEGGFTVESFLARIDYEAGGEREEAVQACPPKCIIRNTRNGSSNEKE